MQTKYLLSLFLFFIISLTVSSQSVYRLKYQLPGGNDTSTYDAFFLKYDNGTGIIRVNSLSPVTHQPAQVELEIMEQYATDKTGAVDTSKVVYKVTKVSDNTIKFVPVDFWFKTDPATNTYVPWGITDPAGNADADPKEFLSSALIKSQELTKDLVLQFFSATDVFYTNLFGAKAKGGMLTKDELNTKLFLLVIASTNDKEIGFATLKDARLAVQSFSDVADFLGIKKSIDTIFGDRYSKAIIEKAVKKINPSPNDIVIFYYSGHGFTNPEKKGKDYPFLDLLNPLQKPRPDPRDSTLNIEDIYELIKQKPARLNLVISDCCNDEILATNNIGTPPVKPKEPVVKKNWANVYSMFMKERMSLLMTSASKNERASSNENLGSFFTFYFFTSLNTYLGPAKANPTWNQVWNDSQVLTATKARFTYCPMPSMPKNICHQTPRVKPPF